MADSVAEYWSCIIASSSSTQPSERSWMGFAGFLGFCFSKLSSQRLLMCGLTQYSRVFFGREADVQARMVNDLKSVSAR